MSTPQHQGKIVCDELDEMVEIVAKLKDQGAFFEVMKSDGDWTIFIQG